MHELSCETQKCHIEKIFGKEYAVGFIPDTLMEGHYLGYKNCQFCIGKSKNHKEHEITSNMQEDI